MEEISIILDKFEPITLKEMDSVKLMNRSDTKFIFRAEQLPIFLNQLTDDFYILDVNGVRKNKYETLYFDTVDFKFFNDHQRGKANRNKVRHRLYVESGLHFFEIKNKNNKGRTNKERIKLKQLEYKIEGISEEFLLKKTHIRGNDLEPKLWGNYTRITLVNKHLPERLTIDTNLIFKFGDKEEFLPEIVIAELKQDKSSKSFFAQLMNKHRIKQASISKYCFGVIFLYKNIKLNNFKPKLNILNKLRYGKI
jgi:hypothetical protein